jgi:hypothetical protein
MSEDGVMTGAELIHKVRRLGRKRGKGDHGVLWYGERRTFVGGRGPLKTGTLQGMLKALGLTLDDLRE